MRKLNCRARSSQQMVFYFFNQKLFRTGIITSIMNNRFLILIDGMTGAGKTTTTKLLADKFPRTAILGMDRIKRFVSDFERGERDNTIAREIVFTLTDKYLDLGLSVIIEQPFKTSEEISAYEALANKYKVVCFKFQLFVSPEIAYSRVINRQKDKEDKVPEERIQRNISLFKNREDLGFVVIDTSTQDEKGAFDIILKTIRSN